METTKSDISIKRNLPCTLTDVEILAKSKEISHQWHEKGTLENRLKETKADFNTKISRCEAEISVLSTAISNGYEYREIPCFWTYFWDEGYKTLTRTDTDAEVERGPIETHERQAHLPGLVPAEKDAEDKKHTEGINPPPAAVVEVTKTCETCVIKEECGEATKKSGPCNSWKPEPDSIHNCSPDCPKLVGDVEVYACAWEDNTTDITLAADNNDYPLKHHACILSSAPEQPPAAPPDVLQDKPKGNGEGNGAPAPTFDRLCKKCIGEDMHGWRDLIPNGQCPKCGKKPRIIYARI